VNTTLRNLFVIGTIVYSLLHMAAGRLIAAPPEPDIEAYFSPRGGATEAILREIGAARSGILVQAYSFTSTPIAEALAAAQRRGVRVEVLLDRSKTIEEKRSKAGFMARSGISVQVDSQHGSAHNKVIILDNRTIITGSYNFTRHSEEDNAENLLIIHNKALATKYLANWKEHAKHSTAYRGEPEQESQEGK